MQVGGSAAQALKRIKKEVDDFNKNPIVGLQLFPDAANQYHFTATIEGPKDSVYENGVFKLDIQIPQEYPFKPPTVKFKTAVFHPNVDGENICLDILKNQWSPALRIHQVLLSISSFLVDPCPENGFGNQATHLMKTDRSKFDETARDWTSKYAKAS